MQEVTSVLTIMSNTNKEHLDERYLIKMCKHPVTLKSLLTKVQISDNHDEEEGREAFICHIYIHIIVIYTLLYSEICFFA